MWGRRSGHPRPPFSAVLPVKIECIFPALERSLGHVTCIGRKLRSPSTLVRILVCPWAPYDNHQNRLKPACWRLGDRPAGSPAGPAETGMWARTSQITQLQPSYPTPGSPQKPQNHEKDNTFNHRYPFIVLSHCALAGSLYAAGCHFNVSAWLD